VAIFIFSFAYLFFLSSAFSLFVVFSVASSFRLVYAALVNYFVRILNVRQS